jgi:hypothetical protein
LENAQQLAFLLLYDKEISRVNFDQFKVETLDDKSWELKHSYYTQAFSFIGDDYLLKPQYADIKKFMSLPKAIGNTNNKILTKPYFDDDSFICPSLKSELSEEEKLALIDFLFDQWSKDNNKQKIKNIDWSKINDTEIEKLLGFNPSSCVYPSEYACENEVLPKYILNWAGNSPAYKKYDDFADCNSEDEISQKLIPILRERHEVKVNTDKNGLWKMDNERKSKVIEIINANYPDLLDFNQEIATKVNVVFPKEDNKELVNLVNQTLKENNIDFANVSLTESVCDFKYNIDTEQYTITIFANDEDQYNAQLARIKNLFPKVSLQSSVYVYKYSLNFKSVVSSGKERIQFLSDMGVWVADTENSVIVDLRKSLKDNSISFDKSRLSKYEGSETMLFNTFEWLKENEIELTTPKQYEIFKKIVDVINENRTNEDLVIQEEFDFEQLEEFSTKWKETKNFTIYQYDGQMPKTVALDEIDDYVFYRYHLGEYAVNEEDSKIYIYKQSDTQKVLRQVALDDQNNFDDSDLSEIFEDELNRLRKKVESLEKQVSTSDDAVDIDLGGWSNDVPSQQQKDWNLEARKIVKEELEKKGYEFTQGIGEYGIIEGVKKDGVEYPLVVLSCKGGKLFINPNQWLRLCKPKALLLGVGQGREIRSFALKQLLGISQEFNLRFKIDKIKDRNYREFAEIFRYFSGVNMQIPIDNTMGTTERLVAFFPPAKTETDINDNESDLL